MLFFKSSFDMVVGKIEIFIRRCSITNQEHRWLLQTETIKSDVKVGLKYVLNINANIYYNHQYLYVP